MAAPMEDQNRRWMKWVTELQALAQTGLTYGDSPYDRERYQDIRRIASEMAAVHSAYPQETIEEIFQAEAGAATPKVDVRGVVFKDGKVLLVRESSDGKWTFPGGWADVFDAPSETVEREVWEESGYQVKAVKLLALYDRNQHGHPHPWPYSYKCFFLCELKGGKPRPSLETTAIGFFGENEIPELSLPRTTPELVARMFELNRVPDSPTDFD